MKKALSLLLAIVMVIGMLPATVLAVGSSSITFETDFTNDLAVGDTFTVTATLADNPGVAAVTLSLKWNESAVSFTGFATEYDEDEEADVLKSDVFSVMSPVVNNELGIITAIRTQGTNTKKNGTLFTATFEIVGEGELGIGLKTDDAEEYMMRDASGVDLNPVIDVSAIEGLTVGGKPVGPEMPEDAPFTAITTDAGAILAIEQQDDVNGVPYYIVTIPADATTAYVTAPDQVIMDDWTTGESQATAYAFNVENNWEQLFISYNYEDSDDGPIVEIPMYMVASDWSGEVELCFVEDEDGYLMHAFGIEDAGYSCLGILSFRYGEEDAGDDEEPTYNITVQQTTGGIIAVFDETGKQINKAKAGDYIGVQYQADAGYTFKNILVNGEAVTMENGFFRMPGNDVTVSAVFEKNHTCDYNLEVVAAKYLKSEATCQSGAVYYKSCTCGGFDNSETAATFVSGDPVACDYENGICKWCGGEEIVLAPNPITEIEVSHPNIEVDEETGEMTMDMVVGADEKIDVSFALTDTTLAPSQIVMWFSSDDTVATVDQNGKVTALKAGTVTITAKAVEVSGISLLAEDEEVLAAITLNVADPNPGYTVNMGQDVSTHVGQTIQIPVIIGHTDAAVLVYNCYELVFRYDPAVLTLLTESSTAIGKDFTVIVNGDTITVRRYGSDLNVGDVAFTLQFEVISGDDTNVKLVSAKVGVSETAYEMEAAEASVIDNITLIYVAAYTVTLPEDFQGESYVTPGTDYTFSVNDPNYDYTVKATVNGVEIEVIDNGDGTYTIAADQITGNIVITTEKTGKIFTVTLGQDMTGNFSAQYMTDYIATLTKVPGFGYTISVSINGQSYTNYAYNENTGVITIPGADITGDIVFTITKEAGEFTVTFTGNCAGHAAGEAVATGGLSYSFTLTKRPGYTYTVTATMGTKAVELSEADGIYTIAVVTGDIVITVTGESDLTVEVTEFVKLDGKSVFLITANQTLAAGEALSYDGTVMFYSNQYNAWCYLVITAGTLSAEDAAAKITIGTVAYTTLDQTYDVNGAGEVDINDAQLVFDMYNNEYQDFSVVTMQKFLNADVNGDQKIDVNDAAAIVAAIINAG